MAMIGNTLGQEICDAICDPSAPPEVRAKVLELWQKIGTAIVKHIQTNAEVPPGIAVETAGTAAKQSGATSAPGKVT